MYWYASQNIHANLYIHIYAYISLYISPCLVQHHNLVRNHIIFKPDNQKWKNKEKAPNSTETSTGDPYIGESSHQIHRQNLDMNQFTLSKFKHGMLHYCVDTEEKFNEYF